MNDDSEIVDYVRQEGSVKTPDVARQFGLTVKAAQETLSRLRREGSLVRTHLRISTTPPTWINEWKALPKQVSIGRWRAA